MCTQEREWLAMSNSVSECPRKIPCDLFSSFWGQLRLSIIYDVVGAIRRREGSEVVLFYMYTHTDVYVCVDK